MMLVASMATDLKLEAMMTELIAGVAVAAESHLSGSGIAVVIAAPAWTEAVIAGTEAAGTGQPVLSLSAACFASDTQHTL